MDRKINHPHQVKNEKHFRQQNQSIKLSQSTDTTTHSRSIKMMDKRFT